VLACRAILKRQLRLVEGRRAASTPFSESGRVEYSLIETHLSCELERMHHNRTLYAVDRSDCGRSSAMSRKMSPNRILGIATSAIWKGDIAAGGTSGYSKRPRKKGHPKVA
jgi:hypothetical protein